GLSHVAVMFLLLARALRSMDPSLDESAATCGSGISATLRPITLALMLPASAAAMIYSFINAVEAFEVRAIIGIPARIYVFSTKIYLVMHQSPPDYGLSAALGMTVLMIAVVGTVVDLRVVTGGERCVSGTGGGC